jgi:hypothetical protein
LSKYNEREAKEMMEAEDEHTASEDDLFDQNFKHELDPSPLTAFLSPGLPTESPGQPTRGPADDDAEEKILINDDSDDDVSPGMDPTMKKVVIREGQTGQAEGDKEAEAAFNFESEQKIFEGQ